MMKSFERIAASAQASIHIEAVRANVTEVQPSVAEARIVPNEVEIFSTEKTSALISGVTSLLSCNE